MRQTCKYHSEGELMRDEMYTTLLGIVNDILITKV